MSILAASADVALTTLRSRQDALAKARALLDDGAALSTFLDDIAGHYQLAISDLEKGMRPADMIPGALAGATIAREAGAFGCYAGMVDVAQALGVHVEILKASG